MAIFKYGVVQKIKTVAVNEQEFEQLKEKIISENALVRCHKCGKLLAKANENGLVSIKRKDMDIIARTTELSIKCPVCSATNQVIL